MIRKSNILWVALTGAVGFGLYHLKHEVQALEDDLFRLNRAILAEQEAIHVLRAEWSYINQPARLQALTSRHLDLQPTKPAQLGTLNGVPARPRETITAPHIAQAPNTQAPNAQGVLEPAAHNPAASR
jgi:hypothetical protein